MYSAPKFRALATPRIVYAPTINGRTFSATGNPIVDDTYELTRALGDPGWLFTFRVGTTAERPTASMQEPSPAGIGTAFLDTTLGYVIVFDGAAWRNPMTGNVV